MFVNKIGQQHLEYGMNCQDYGVEKEKSKMVCDGCSEGKHSEVGVKLFCHMVDLGFGIPYAFETLVNLFPTQELIRDYICFTILYVTETDSHFVTGYCGDGYFILQDQEDNITFEKIDDGEYPKYYAYNYCEKDKLKHYKEGVPFIFSAYDKREYKNIGVASDGIRFIVDSEDEKLKNEFIELLKTGSSVKMKRFINRNQKLFKDDVTIVF